MTHSERSSRRGTCMYGVLASTAGEASDALQSRKRFFDAFNANPEKIMAEVKARATRENAAKLAEFAITPKDLDAYVGMYAMVGDLPVGRIVERNENDEHDYYIETDHSRIAIAHGDNLRIFAPKTSLEYIYLEDSD